MNYTDLNEGNELKRKIDFCKTILSKGSPDNNDGYKVIVKVFADSLELKDDFLNDFCEFIQTKLKQYEEEFRELWQYLKDLKLIKETILAGSVLRRQCACQIVMKK